MSHDLGNIDGVVARHVTATTIQLGAMHGGKEHGRCVQMWVNEEMVQLDAAGVRKLLDVLSVWHEDVNSLTRDEAIAWFIETADKFAWRGVDDAVRCGVTLVDKASTGRTRWIPYDAIEKHATRGCRPMRSAPMATNVFSKVLMEAER